MQKNPIRTLKSTTVYQSKRLALFEDEVEVGVGGRLTYSHLSMMPGVTVFPLTEDGEIWLVREYKYALQRHCIEAMSGGIESGEAPLSTAKRELQEELGLRAESWEDLGVINPFTSSINSPNYMFVARGLHPIGRNLDLGEVIEPIKVKLSQAVEWVMQSEILHGGSAVGILKIAAGKKFNLKL